MIASDTIPHKHSSKMNYHQMTHQASEEPETLENSSIESTSGDEQDTEIRASFSQQAPLTSRNDEDSSRGTKRKTQQMASSLLENSKIMKMMSKMAYKEGEGLGKHGQGRQAPIEASAQKGRRGLGFEHKELQEANYKFNPEEEMVQAKEEITWLTADQDCPPTSDELQDWMTLGKYKTTIDDEVTFCEPDIVKEVVNCKSVFDKLDRLEMREARTRSNPFETIRSNIFLNRAAVKMANIDRACDMMFTKPRMEPNELLYFADVCAGPGGFSEYVLWRKKWRGKGFGFTLKRSCDFKLDDFMAGPSETFHPYYGPFDDINKQGDVFLPENQEALYELVMKHTDGAGVHFMMSDGGFSVEGQENIQEILSKQLYLCQCLVALMIVREGGHFVTKLFDLFTPFSAGLVYLMYRCFSSVSIFKPNTSRPANSERYLICRGKRFDVSAVIEHLKQANLHLLMKQKNKDVVDLVPMEILLEDDKFYDYLKSSNEDLGKKQIVGLLKIAAYAEDKQLVETRQKEMSQECLEYWGLPTNASRTAPKGVQPDEMIRELAMSSTIANCKPDSLEQITTENVESTFGKIFCNWYFVPCQYGEEDKAKTPCPYPTFYLGMGRSKIFEYRSGWKMLGNDNLNVELPAKTLVYGEIVQEYEKEGKSQRHLFVLHIIDALVLGGEKIDHHDLDTRHKLIKLFCKALYKVERNAPVQVRAKDFLPLDRDIQKRLQLSQRRMKSGAAMRLGYDLPKTCLSNTRDKNEPSFFIPKSIMFLKYTKNDWDRSLSRTHNMFYMTHPSQEDPRQNKFECDMKERSHIATFSDTFKRKVIWNWPMNSSMNFFQYVNVQFKK